MQPTISKIQEQKAAEAFNKQSAVFDAIYSPNLIIQYKRKRVRDHVEKYLPLCSNILELNAGTGEDAVYFASKGHYVHATDIAAEMQQQLIKKVSEAGLSKNVSTETCSFNNLPALQNKGPYDLIFSNFAGLNCTGDLDKVLQSFTPLLKQGGITTLVVMPDFCWWETMLALRGNFKLAFRRFHSKHGVKANVEGVSFTCWYYSPDYITSVLKDEFELLSVEGLCTIVPPSYFENFPVRFPGLFAWLQKAEKKLKRLWPWKTTGDYFIISLRKK
jgi:ubiquinone/menaquinone biosynthesis C-methylase UbiE